MTAQSFISTIVDVKLCPSSITLKLCSSEQVQLYKGPIIQHCAGPGGHKKQGEVVTTFALFHNYPVSRSLVHQDPWSSYLSILETKHIVSSRNYKKLKYGSPDHLSFLRNRPYKVADTEGSRMRRWVEETLGDGNKVQCNHRCKAKMGSNQDIHQGRNG